MGASAWPVPGRSAATSSTTTRSRSWPGWWSTRATSSSCARWAGPSRWYGLVTGFLERGEEPEAGVLRELREELGLEGRVVAPIGVYAFPERNELILAYHIEAWGEVRLGKELAGLKRIRPEKLRPWPVGTGHAVRDWLARRSVGPSGQR